MKVTFSLCIGFLAAVVVGVALPDAGTPNAAPAVSLERRQKASKSIPCHDGQGACDNSGNCVIHTGGLNFEKVKDSTCKTQ